jgi:tetratricopeptide (TPR) repeat protein
MKTTTLEELAYRIKEAKTNNLPKPIVFLGAGASKTGGIPLAGEIASHILKTYPTNPKIANLNVDNRKYSQLMDCLTPYERNELLKVYIDEAKINVTHIYLAQLIANDYIDYVLTVNFDNLMLRALALYNIFPPTYDLAILKDLTTTTFKEKSVVYLHGQHHGLWLLNTQEEMNKVKDYVPPILNKIANQRLWIFIGYSGGDPIFPHIVNLGRFDNGLYWITYRDHDPDIEVCMQLLDKPNTNTYVLKGYDSDSFMLKLSNELNQPQPVVVEKPFTALIDQLNNIVDIDDQEHFKGVKERLEISKNNVYQAIDIFEEGKKTITVDIENELVINQLKKKIIDKISNEDYLEEEIIILEKEIEKLNNPELNNLMADLYNGWGNFLSEYALQKSDEEKFEESIEKYRKALSISPHNGHYLYNLATTLLELAGLKKDESIYLESINNFKNANLFVKEDVALLSNWGNAVAGLAILKKDNVLFEEALSLYKKVSSIDSSHLNTLISWGATLLDYAELTSDNAFFKQSIEKSYSALNIDKDNEVALNNLGFALIKLYENEGNEINLREGNKIFQELTTIYPDNMRGYYNWATSLIYLAKQKNNKELYEKSKDILYKALEIDPHSILVLGNLSYVLLVLFKNTPDNLMNLSEAIRISTKLHSLNGFSYNLACAYALSKNKIQSLSYLQKSLESKEITSTHVKEDEDFKEFWNDLDFVDLLSKYESKV